MARHDLDGVNKRFLLFSRDVKVSRRLKTNCGLGLCLETSRLVDVPAFQCLHQMTRRFQPFLKVTLWCRLYCQVGKSVKLMTIPATRVTVCPGFPGHILFLCCYPSIRSDFQKFSKTLQFVRIFALWLLWLTSNVSGPCTFSHLNVHTNSRGNTFTAYLPMKASFIK